MNFLSNKINALPKWFITTLVIIFITALAYKHLDYYLNLDFNLLFSLILIPVIMYIPDKKVKSIRFGLLSLIFLVSYPFLKIQTSFFFGLCFLILFIIESQWGKLNKGAFFLIILCSPMISHMVKVFGFPIRLKLSDMAVTILNNLGMEVSANGNSILMNGNEFYVEPACIGLNMVITSFLLCLTFISYYEKLEKKQLSYVALYTNFALTFGLVVVSNLIRIILLILFKAEENTLAHEIIGILCLLVYVILPLMKIIPWSVSIANYSKLKLKDKSLSSSLDQVFVKAFTFSLVLIVGYYSFKGGIYVHQSYKTVQQLPQIEGFESSKVAFDGTKLENNEALIYLKPCKNYWGGDHNPIICWRGSGYKFKKEKEVQIEGEKIYVAELSKGVDKLYTAWWFSNGEHVTNSQLDWRWKMAKGAKPFTLVNVSCENESELEKQVIDLLSRKI